VEGSNIQASCPVRAGIRIKRANPFEQKKGKIMKDWKIVTVFRGKSIKLLTPNRFL
jgi:hypothetical protein